MAESGININLDSAKQAVESIKTANNKIELIVNDLGSNPFKPLCSTDPDLASNYVAEYLASITEMYTFANDKIYNALESYISSISDEENGNQSSDNNSSGGGNGGGSGGNGGNGGSSDSDITTPIVPPVIPPSDDTSSIDTTKWNEWELDEVASVVNTLKDLSENAGLGIDEMLLQEILADKLKEALLASQDIPDELKEQLKDADSKVIMKVFESIMKGENPEIFDINPLNLGIVYSRLMAVAEENGITLEELLSSSDYIDLLKETLKEFEDSVDLLQKWDNLSASEYQEKLLDVYDGNGIGDIKPSAVEIVRSFVDYISDSTEINSEELLTESKYAEIIKKGAQEFAKTSVFIGATSHYSSSGMQSVVGNLFNGSNPKALGMDNDEVAGFREEIDTLAEKNGITANELLMDSKYADTVKETLNNSKNAAEVGTIYLKSESTVSQTVAKNLYNSVLDTAHEQTIATLPGGIGVVSMSAKSVGD